MSVTVGIGGIWGIGLVNIRWLKICGVLCGDICICVV